MPKTQNFQVLSKAIDEWRFFGQQALYFEQKAWVDDPASTAMRFVERKFPYALSHGGVTSALCTQSLLSGRWAVSGFPVVNLTHRLAATLMATNVPAEILEDVKCPWHGVVVRIPSDLLFLDHHGVPEPAVLLGFAEYGFHGESRWSYSVSTEKVRVDETGFYDAISLWGIHLPPSALVGDLPAMWDMLERTDGDARVDGLVRRLMVGLCLFCSDPKKLGTPRQTQNRSRKDNQRNGQELPDFENWFLGQDIELDIKVVEAIRAYGREGGSSPKVQSLVAGHWKRQAHGSGRSLRKLIHVMPYWRGPLDAPVLDRSGS